VVEDLRRIAYGNTLSFSRYNEPLADRVILERLAYARRRLPRATLHLNTNGDYLDRELLYDLHQAGLRSLNLQIYLPEGVFDDAAASRLVEERVVRLGLSSRPGTQIPGQWVERTVEFMDLRLRAYARNFQANGSDRGGALAALSCRSTRHSPCMQPFFNLYIDHNGSVMPCCNLRSDLPEHARYVAGNISEPGCDIISLFAGARLAAWRRDLAGFGAKRPPCATCRFDTVRATAANLAGLLALKGRQR